MANISETIREEAKMVIPSRERERTEEDVVMSTWNMEVNGHRNMGKN